MTDGIRFRYLIVAAETGSFRSAAEVLRVRQSSVSRAIRHVEERIGVSLFDRSYRGVQLTEAGRRFLSRAIPAIEQLENAKITAAAAGRAEIGTVRIGIQTSLTKGFLRNLLQNYSTKHPDVGLDIHDGTRHEHIAGVRSHRLDIAFLAGMDEIPDCVTTPLWRERIYVALPKEHRLAIAENLSWSELRCENFIVSTFSPGAEVHDHIVKRASTFGTLPRIEYKAVLQDTLLNLVGLGYGITLISSASTSIELPDVVLRPLPDETDIVPFSAVWSPQNDNPAFRRFLSVAHILAGRIRRGSSDWAARSLDLTSVDPSPSEDDKIPDPSP
ncbi:LysR family transcriptional regulator [Pinisolibacter aquiterrae]|uniref:LysR family transcriptional regulator n=1 Tax=Pinisolibacter aquiterrae TaxID=2815579 RepID=UPI001C3C6F50|nr:LysR family transcriptional regulator [Pinisolibacter aquiterrae]MBV5265026.1 LysR family transcriptional regulator [Pinisolibacter aquiterrae]MCC8235592.1 LysR family transcriptional regulator [Pinisolibacter aquiterrae]